MATNEAVKGTPCTECGYVSPRPMVFEDKVYCLLDYEQQIALRAIAAAIVRFANENGIEITQTVERVQDHIDVVIEFEAHHRNDLHASLLQGE